MFRHRKRSPRKRPLRLPAQEVRLTVRFVDEPSLRTSRLALAGLIAAALVVGGAGFLIGRVTTPAAPAEEGVTDSSIPLPAPTWTGPLARPDLIALGALAADATAAGMDPDISLRQNEGRRFEIRLPFGCHGPASEDDPSGWIYDEASRTLRVFVTPEQWEAADWFPSSSAGTAIESVEGFWIERPWTSSEACPPPVGPAPMVPVSEDDNEDAATAAPSPQDDTSETSEAAPAPSAAPPTLAIGQIYTAESPRSSRRNGEPFRAVVRLQPADLEVSQGFRLRISGRLTGAAGSVPAVCRQSTPMQPPVCLITAAVDEVSIENPVTGTTLATWTLAQRSVAAGE